MNSIVIIGGGHAAAQLCASLHEAGQGARVHLVCEEGCVPYQRPPLSKTFLKSAEQGVQPHRDADWWAQTGVTLHLGDAAVAIDRPARTVTLRSGAVLPFEHLVLATGNRARRLPDLPAGLSNVLTLRDAQDAGRLRERLGVATQVTVLGGGFIGLEVAATAAALGKRVRVLEAAPRLLGRAVSPQLSAHALEAHRAAGIEVVLGARIGGFEVDGERLAALAVNGEREAVDLLLLSIGAVPETALAEAAGLACADGIVVDTYMRTSDPAVLAVGDCARFPDARDAAAAPRRLESVQNANDQARIAAATLAGAPRAYDALPWFWSDQGTLRLQMAGLVPAEGTPGLQTVRRAGPGGNGFTLFHYLGDRLMCVETANAPADHIMARKILEAGRHPTPAQVTDTAVPLKTLLA